MKVEKRFIADDGTAFEDAINCLEYESYNNYTDSEIETVVEHIAFPFCHYANAAVDFYLVSVSSIDDIKKLLCFCHNCKTDRSSYAEIVDKCKMCLDLADDDGDFSVPVSFVMSYDDEICVIEDYDIERMIADTLVVFRKIKDTI